MPERRPKSRVTSLAALACFASLSVLSCSSDGGGPTAPAVTTGTVAASVGTSGPDAPAAFTAALDDGTPQSIDANGSTSFTSVDGGSHTVTLGDVPDNCTVGGTNPRATTVTVGQTANVAFSVSCEAPSGAIEVTTSTTGPDIDADGYTVDVDGESAGSADANGTVTFTGVSEGAHTVTLTDIAANCTVTGDNPVAATVVIGEVETVAFDLTCTVVNFEPTATISSPDTTSTDAPLYVAPGAAVTFTGAATDPEDGPLTGGALVWVSNVDGQIGTGETFMTSSLSEGQHAVTLTATDSEFSSGTETVLVIVNPPPAAGYQIALRLAEGTTLTPGQQTAIDDAIVKLESIITGDLPGEPIAFEFGPGCPGPPVVDETVDDLVIYLTVGPIDGPGGVLGQAGPCWVRFGSFLPALGRMIFDSADLAGLEAAGEVDEVLLHEAMHVMGFGTIWGDPGLDILQDPTDPDDDPAPDTHFPGAAAIAQFGSVGGDDYTGVGVVPVENDNDNWGLGSLNGHWREGVFNHELMTPELNMAPDAPLSVVTVGAFEDLGYTVDYGAADPYTHMFSLRAQGGTPSLDLSNDIWNGPLWVGDGSGNARRIR